MDKKLCKVCKQKEVEKEGDICKQCKQNTSPYLRESTRKPAEKLGKIRIN